MKTQLSLQYLLKTQDTDIFIFDRDEKGNVIFKNNPQQFISYRNSSFCNQVIETIESDEKLICRIGEVLTQIDTRHICEIYKNSIPIEVMYLSTDANGDYYSFFDKLSYDNLHSKFSFEFLTNNYFFIKTTDWEKHLAKNWDKK